MGALLDQVMLARAFRTGRARIVLRTDDEATAHAVARQHMPALVRHDETSGFYTVIVLSAPRP